MKLFLECYADEVLARVAGVPPRAVIHSHGKGKVSKSLANNSGVIGLVDEDVGSAQPRTLSKFVQVSSDHDLRLKIDKSHNNRLVVVCPKLEHWVIKTAKEANIKMKDFNLSENAHKLHADVNDQLRDWESLLNELLVAKSGRLLRLKSLLLG